MNRISFGRRMAYQILHQKVKRALNIGDSGYRSQRLENVAVSG